MMIKRYLLNYCCYLGLYYWFIICMAVDDSPATVVVNNLSNNNDNNGTFQKRQAMFWPTCMPLSVINGQVDYLQTNPSISYSSGTTAILTCNFGFTIVGSSNSICMNSIWSPPLGSCVLGGLGVQSFNLGNGNGPLASPAKSTRSGSSTQCFSEMPPINGQLHYSQNGMFGAYPSSTTVSLSCNPGTSSIGASTSTCENGSWQPPLGFCSNHGSGSSMSGVTIANGNSVNPLSATLASAASTLDGGMPQCPNVPRPSNGHVSYSLTQTGKGYPIGTIATLLCNPGLVPNQMTSICGAGGSWSPQLGFCNPLSDPAGGVPSKKFSSLMNSPSGSCILGLLPPIGAMISYSRGDAFGPYPSGSVATLTCHSGHPIGPLSATCESGQWNPPFFHGCSMWESRPTRTFQDSPDDITTSSVNPDPSAGFVPSVSGGLGMPSSNMLPMGMGMLGSQICTLGVPPIVGGTIAYSQGGDLGPYPSGTVATIKCHSGQPIGLTSSSCLNGMWQPPSIGFCSNSEQESKHIATGFPLPTVSSGLPTPPAITLGSEGMMASGGSEMPNPMSPTGSMGEIPPNLIEINNGMSGIIGLRQGNQQLQQQCLLSLLPPLNGHITYSSSSSQAVPDGFGPYPQGTIATLRCNPGFSPSGPAMSTCRNGMFELMLGQCMPSNSETEMQINNNSMPPHGNDDQRRLNTREESQQELEAVTKRLENTPKKDVFDEMSEKEELPSCSDLTLDSPDFGSIIYSNGKDVEQPARTSAVTAATLVTTQTMIKHGVGSVATLTCHEGFISIGDTTARCESNGWTVRTLGKCVPRMTTFKQNLATPVIVTKSVGRPDFNT